MAYTFSKKSLKKLEGVDDKLVGLAEMAISVSDVDFGITEGLRSKERQQMLYDTKRSQTLNSKHIVGRAIDVVAWIGKEPCWELAVYDDIADAFAMASRAHNVPLKWGCAWTVSDIGTWNGTMEMAMNSYIDIRRSQDRRPFLDGPHFELSD